MVSLVGYVVGGGGIRELCVGSLSFVAGMGALCLCARWEFVGGLVLGTQALVSVAVFLVM